jgi:hypothetical protein
VNGLRPKFSAQQAEVVLTRRRFARTRAVLRFSANLIRRLLRRPTAPSATLAIPLELVWLPQYWVRFVVEDSRKTKRFEAIVCGHSQGAAACDLSRQQWQSIDGPAAMPASLAETVARQQARDGLTATMMQAPKWSNRNIVGDAVSELIGYPYWVYYYRRRGDKLDIKLLDAMTGRVAGPKAKAAFLAALAHQKRVAATSDEAPR